MLYSFYNCTSFCLQEVSGLGYLSLRFLALFIPLLFAFYLFPKLDKEKFGIVSDQQFALDLLHAKNLLIIPSSGFGWKGNDHFRIVMLPEKEILKKAMEDLGDFLSEYKQNR